MKEEDEELVRDKLLLAIVGVQAHHLIKGRDQGV
jgi:hypothetical protein